MQIAIPSESDQKLDSTITGHFGHAPYFTVVTFDDDMNITNTEAIKNVNHDEVGCDGVISYVVRLHVDAVLASSIDMFPLMVFTQQGMKVYVDQKSTKVSDAVKNFVAGKVTEVTPESVHQN